MAWTVVAHRTHAQAAGTARAVHATAYRHALAAGFDRAFLIAAGIALLIVLVTVTAIRIRRSDLAGR